MGEIGWELGRASAEDQLAALARGELSAVELLAHTAERHARINPLINAVVTVDWEAARATAAESDRRRAAGESVRPLEGLPVAVKDLEDTAGMRTTFGSARFADHVPDRDSLVVSRLRAAGAVVYGKSNTPEFGTGSHTTNRVFGTTTNPYDPSRSAGGSSGGAAAALAAGLTAVADGSDMGGSLRNPAAFCNVVGLRPSIGLVPDWPSRDAWQSLATNGPMGRTVGDTALLLSVLAGEDRHAPLSFPGRWGDAAGVPIPVPILDRRLRIGWSRTLGGLPIDPEISEVLERDGLATLGELGHSVLDREPDMTGADTAFRVLRGAGYAHSFGAMLAGHRDELGPELIANTEYGLGLTLPQYLAAAEQRTAVFGRMVRLFSEIDVLAAPVTMSLPFPAEERWPRSVAGEEQEDYLGWMRASWRISLTGFAALSIPCGFSSSGLPVGLQLIVPPRGEDLLLALAREFEAERPVWREAPPICAAAP